MRYVVAMVVAALFALFAAIFVSSPIASWAISRMTFDSPDDVANLHALIYMAGNVAALLVGWLVGWIAGSRLAERDGVA